MSLLSQPFKFPRKLWLVLSFACFLYLFLTVAVNDKGNQPTAWRSFLDGDIGIGSLFGVLWLGIGLALGAFIATLLGIVRQVLLKSKRGLTDGR
jgi:hypothetical protein